jgi:hypothetical protein
MNEKLNRGERVLPARSDCWANTNFNLQLREVKLTIHDFPMILSAR